jgi:hypothetical protein
MGNDDMVNEVICVIASVFRHGVDERDRGALRRT